MLSTSATLLFAASIALMFPPRIAKQQAAPDNSAQNAGQQRTADSQPNGRADRATLAQVRRAIIADKSLSVYGHNVKVLVVGGKVTLKGPVHSVEEKERVVSDVGMVVDPGQVVDHLTVDK